MMALGFCVQMSVYSSQRVPLRDCAREFEITVSQSSLLFDYPSKPPSVSVDITQQRLT
jgi:hypothetical protein